MNVAAKLGLYGLFLILVFTVTFFGGRALIPEETVATWTREAEESTAEHDEMTSGAHGNSHEEAVSTDGVTGLSVEESGYRISEVEAPGSPGQEGNLAFRILGRDGSPVTEFEVDHEKKLHLIVVRADGEGFEHAHPRLDPTSGVWSLPWTWGKGGTYRLYADFVPAFGPGAGSGITLGTSLEVAGRFDPAPQPPLPARRAQVGGFDVTLSGDLEAGTERVLTARVTRDGQPETHLEPYLGAFGHLVALRDGDLAYLHVHPDEGEGHQPEEGHDHGHSAPTGGPEIRFVTEAPSPGRYLLYLDFKVDGEVHTANFVLEAK